MRGRRDQILRMPAVGLGLLVLCASACGGQSVEPLDPRDATLPGETRQWIADAEDGVVVARARLQLMREHLESERTVRRRMGGIEWTGGAAGQMEEAAGQLGAARVALAEAAVKQAELAVSLAQAKYDLANAERAMLHDLASYDLQPLRDAAEAVRVQLRAESDAVVAQQKTTDRATQRFWSAYAAYVRGGGKTEVYWETDLASSE